MIIVKNENVVVRKIHGTTFLINITDNFSGDRCALYEVNETGLYIWNQIDGCRGIEDIASLLKAAIIDDVDYQVLLHDVAEFVEYLISKQFLEVLSCG